MALIYKILGGDEWRAAQAKGCFEGSTIDRADGFIHFSTAGQLAETARRHFCGRRDLVVLAVETAGLGAALKWEVSRGGALFPHLYGPLDCARVLSARPVAPVTDADTDLDMDAPAP
jgi:uncharacterized protein (DUF952 family)